MWDNYRLLRFFANLLILAAFAMLASAGWLWVTQSGLFPVRSVHIRSKLTHVTQEQLRFIAEHELRGSFLTVNLNNTRGAFEKLPWVRKVLVQRVWPDRLDISVEEHVAVARWGEEGLVNSYGEWFDAASSSQTLPLLKGPPESHAEMTAALTAFRRTLKPLTLAPKSITLSERRAWQVLLDNGIWLDLGRQDALPRLNKFASSWQNDLSRLPFRIEYVDLRYPNGLAVKMPDYKPSKVAKLKPTA